MSINGLHADEKWNMFRACYSTSFSTWVLFCFRFSVFSVSTTPLVPFKSPQFESSLCIWNTNTISKKISFCCNKNSILFCPHSSLSLYLSLSFSPSPPFFPSLSLFLTLLLAHSHSHSHMSKGNQLHGNVWYERGTEGNIRVDLVFTAINKYVISSFLLYNDFNSNFKCIEKSSPAIYVWNARWKEHIHNRNILNLAQCKSECSTRKVIQKWREIYNTYSFFLHRLIDEKVICII